MKAITFSDYGDPDVLRFTELPDPEPGPGQVRIRIKAAGVQPVDCAVRSGWFANRSNSFRDEFPVVLGNEFAGTVDRAGENVSRFSVGNEVLGWQILACYAEYVVVPVIYGDGLADRVRTVATDGVDAAIDAAGRGALEASIELVQDRNRIGTLVDFDLAPKLGVRSIRSKRSAERLKELSSLYASGKLQIHIRNIYPLHRASDAHHEVETGHGRGKVVLKVS